MTNVEFKALLKDVFANTHMMNGRSYHTVNELLHVLRYDSKLKCLKGVNITVNTEERCTCITCLEAFVNLDTLGVWFDDNSIEFESDEFEYDGEQMRFDNITVYEREVN
jgi:hypothetical protein